MPLADAQPLILLAILATLVFGEFLRNLLLSTVGILFPSAVSNSRARLLDIYCLLLGTDNVIRVQISDNEPVIELKSRIIELDINFAIRALILHLVDIPDDENLVEKVNQLHLGKETEIPRPSTKLSALFPTTPKENTVHFVVQFSGESGYIIPLFVPNDLIIVQI